MKKLSYNRKAYLEGDNLIVFDYLKAGLIRVMTFGERGFIRAGLLYQGVEPTSMVYGVWSKVSVSHHSAKKALPTASVV
jgi:hypothetical protein